MAKIGGIMVTPKLVLRGVVWLVWFILLLLAAWFSSDAYAEYVPTMGLTAAIFAVVWLILGIGVYVFNRRSRFFKKKAP